VNRNKFFSKPVLVAAILVVIAVSCATIAATYLFSLIQQDVEGRLNDTLEASINKAKQELGNYQRDALYWSENLQVRQVAQLLSAGGATAVEADLYSNLDSTLTAITETERYRDFKLLNASGQILFSGRNGIETKPRDYELPAEVIANALAGDIVFTLPFESSQRWPDRFSNVLSNIATMLVISPVYDWYGDIVALFAFELDPDLLFIPAFHRNQIGKTGQTYAIDRDGVLLTESKFQQQLIDIGLLSSSYPHADLNLRIADPGKNLLKLKSSTPKTDQPLTLMARSLVKQQAGTNIEGYRDYRGIKVIGSWRWVNELDMGVVTETEVAEVYKLYRSILYSVIFSVIVVVFMTAIGTLMYRRSTMQRIASLQQRDAIINQTDDGFITINKQGQITMINPAVTALFGYTSEELINHSVSVLLPEAEREQHDKYLAASDLHAPRIINQSRALYGRHKDGTVFPIELNVSPMEFGSDKFFIGVIRDISERQKYQEELINAMQEAEQANKAKSEFLTKMSHELRTPLNAIIGFSQLLQLEDISEDQRESISMIKNSGDHLLTLINDVLDLSRIESGHMTFSVEDVEVKALINHVLPLIEVQLTPLSLKLETDYPDDIDQLFVLADYLKLKQVLLNLLSNAIKYNRPNGLIRLIVRRQSNQMIRIAVEDCGEGIAQDMQSHLFEPFNRLDKEKSAIPGTGIGLAISHELVKLMGGQLNFESRQSQGSTFWLDLKKSDLIERSLYNQKSHTEHRIDAVDKDIKLLCIEDNPTNLELIKQFTSRHDNFFLLTADNAETGLELARESQPDIIMMDINLPGMNGYEALKQLKQSALTRYIKVIALSANAMSEDIDSGLTAGFDAYITKPIMFEKLLATIDELMQSN
jgi:PAS domain S-box-containing protein